MAARRRSTSCSTDSSLTAGHVTTTRVRQRLVDYTNHPKTSTAHRWALTAASRDHWTPGMDALGQTDPAEQHATIGDVASDSTAVGLGGQWTPIDPAKQPAVARLRTSRRLSRCLARDPIAGVFENIRGA